MQLPGEVPVMILRRVTLFPAALLPPLHIFEPRYRRMLADALAADRLLCVAMQKPGVAQETPVSVAGLGLIRVAVQHRDGTSHLILQGLTRVELLEVVRSRPYRVQRIRVLPQTTGNDLAVDALVARVRELVEERLNLGLPLPLPAGPELGAALGQLKKAPEFLVKEMLKYFQALKDPEHVVDLVSCAVLRGAAERQTILETVNLEARLRHLVRFLLAEIGQQRKGERA
jgi:ATP-dependent Lon protease